MYSITAVLVLSSPCVANRILRDFDADDLDVEVDASVAEPFQTKNAMPQGAGEHVNWEWMTPTFSWAGRADQEEYDVVQGHTCQGNGYYDNSYYAASLCYWHPEAEHVASQHWGIMWRGGYGEKEFCGGLGLQSGVCAKCSVCHDNSRDRDAQVDNAAERLEIIPLPDDCMKEGAIEAECNHQFEANNGQLLTEEARCREVQGRYEEAMANFNTISSAIANSEASITQLVHDIAHGHPTQPQCGAETLANMRQPAVNGCRRFGVRDRHSNQEIMDMRPHCELPPTYVRQRRCESRSEEIRNRAECREALSSLGLSEPPGWNGRCEPRPNERICKVESEDPSNTTHRRCEECRGYAATLHTALAESQRHERLVEEWNGRLEQHMQVMANQRNSLAQSYQNLPHATQWKGAMETEWNPQQQHCQEVYSSVQSARNANMMACAPRYYDQSCEKACVEIQRFSDQGCGVVEGSAYGDAFGRGGVEVTCTPPAPSWIMSPSNYGGSPHPNTDEQCGRIQAVRNRQGPRMTTPVMMDGWLTIPSTSFWSRAQRNYYVLESGNGVRSGTLRVFDGALPDGTERSGGDDGIIMWDAEEVSATDTDGSQACFEIKHRYDGRTTSWQRSGVTKTLCVMRDDNRGNIRQLRDQWVSTLQGLLVWRPRVA